MSLAAERHITAQERLRTATQAAVLALWAGLASYDESEVPGWLAAVLPIVLGAQRQSASMTAAFLAASTGGLPVGADMAVVTGAAVRAGVEPAEVYRRPFVQVWSALAEETPYADAVAQGGQRARSTAGMDVQLSMRATLADVGARNPRILGYQRVPDAGACKLCKTIARQRYTVRQLMPLHNGCGCGVDVITPENRGNFTGRPENDLSVTSDDGVQAAVREHGELGPVLTDGAHEFTRL